jgi:hypothetical protein
MWWVIVAAAVQPGACVAAVNWLDNATISASNRSNGRADTATAGAAGPSARVIDMNPDNHPGTTKTVAT